MYNRVITKLKQLTAKKKFTLTQASFRYLLIRWAKKTADFPYIGIETEKPATKPVSIGNNHWLGHRCTILKGCIIGDEVIVGAGAIASNINADRGILAGNPARVINRSGLK